MYLLARQLYLRSSVYYENNVVFTLSLLDSTLHTLH